MAEKLTVEQIEVPAGMVEAFAIARFGDRRYSDPVRDEMRKWLSFALLWLAENPIVPSPEQANEMFQTWNGEIGVREPRGDYRDYRVAFCSVEWQRRMFLKKPDPVPEEVKALLFPGATNDRGETTTVVNRRIANEQILAAVEIGRRLEREAR